MSRWNGSEPSGPERSEGLAPVTPLFGKDDARAWHPAWTSDPEPEAGSALGSNPGRRAAVAPDRARGRVRFVEEPDLGGEASRPDTSSSADTGADAERMLMRKLRTRALSVSEARSAVAGHLDDPDAVEALLGEFTRRGYLDDTVLAEQLVHTAITRKRQGRRAIGGELTRRGIPRAVADAALASLPDDDDERALEFARTKARTLAHVDREAALRRLVGQLSRRGFPSSIAMSAARTALAELD